MDIILECSIICFFLAPLNQGFFDQQFTFRCQPNHQVFFFCFTLCVFGQRIGTMNCHQRSSPRIFWCPVSVQSFATLVLLKQWQMQVWNVPGTSWLQNKTKEFWKKEVKCEFRLNTEFLWFFVVTDVKLLQFLCFLYLFTFCCCFHSAVGQGAHTSICFPGDDCNEFHEFDRRGKGEPIFSGCRWLL